MVVSFTGEGVVISGKGMFVTRKLFATSAMMAIVTLFWCETLLELINTAFLRAMEVALGTMRGRRRTPTVSVLDMSDGFVVVELRSRWTNESNWFNHWRFVWVLVT